MKTALPEGATPCEPKKPKTRLITHEEITDGFLDKLINKIVVDGLRKFFGFRYKPRWEVSNETLVSVSRVLKDGSIHKVPLKQVACSLCGRYVPKSSVDIDHIIPVIPLEGPRPDHKTLARRILCEKSNLQRACQECHETKTTAEKLAKDNIRWGKEMEEVAEVMSALKNLTPAAQDLKPIRTALRRLSKTEKFGAQAKQYLTGLSILSKHGRIFAEKPGGKKSMT